MPHPFRFSYGKPLRSQTRIVASSRRQDLSEPSPFPAEDPANDSDRTRHHLHRFFEQLLRRSEH